MSTPRVLLADAATQWHQELLAALGEDASSVEITDDGEVLKQALAEPKSARRVIIVGDGLRRLGGLDALFATAAARGGASEPKPGATVVLLILDVRHDMELAELLRARGVQGFLRRVDPVDDVATKIRDHLYVGERVAPRHPIKAEARLEVGDQSVAASLEDLSSGGALIVVPSKKLQPTPPIDAKLAFETRIASASLRLPCVLRRVGQRKGLFGNRLALGVSFQNLTPDEQQALETALANLRGAPLADKIAAGVDLELLSHLTR